MPAAHTGTPASTRRPGTTVYTIGHGDRESRELVATLREAGIDVVVDVRSHPGSRRFPWFTRGALAAALADAGLEYRWLGRELGGKRRASAEADRRHPALGTRGLRAFAAWMESGRFAAAAGGLAVEAAARSPALLCAERDPAQCHRWLIADYLVAVRGVTVAHLAYAERSHARHRISDSARLNGDVLRYDRGATADLDLGASLE